MRRFRVVLAVLLAAAMLSVLVLPAVAMAATAAPAHKASGPMTIKKVEAYRVRVVGGYTKYRLTVVQSGHTYYYFTSAAANPPVSYYQNDVKHSGSFTEFRTDFKDKLVSMKKSRDSISFVNIRKYGSKTYLRGVVGLTYDYLGVAE